MPPELACLLMLGFGCELRIIQAIDLGQEWMSVEFDGKQPKTNEHNALAWYDGIIGQAFRQPPGYCAGTFVWPDTCKYAKWAGYELCHYRD